MQFIASVNGWETTLPHLSSLFSRLSSLARSAFSPVSSVPFVPIVPDAWRKRGGSPSRASVWFPARYRLRIPLIFQWFSMFHPFAAVADVARGFVASEGDAGPGRTPWRGDANGHSVPKRSRKHRKHRKHRRHRVFVWRDARREGRAWCEITGNRGNFETFLFISSCPFVSNSSASLPRGASA